MGKDPEFTGSDGWKWFLRHGWLLLVMPNNVQAPPAYAENSDGFEPVRFFASKAKFLAQFE